MQNPTTVRVVNVNPEDIPYALNTPLEQLGEVVLKEGVVFPEKSKQHVLQKTNILLKRIASAEIQADSIRSKRWKTRRQCLVEIEDIGGHQALGYKSFHAFCAEKFPKKHFNPYFEERRCGRYEKLLGLPLCSYGRAFFIPLNAIQVFPRHHGNQWVETIELSPPPRKIELLQMAWAQTLVFAGGKPVQGKHLYLAVEELHDKYPSEVNYPSTANSSASDKQTLRRLQRENQELKKQATELSRLNLLILAFGLATGEGEDDSGTAHT